MSMQDNNPQGSAPNAPAKRPLRAKISPITLTEASGFDEKIETPGGTFYVDGGSILYLIGSIMDWREDDFAAGFVFENPNAKGACGCGESFTV